MNDSEKELRVRRVAKTFVSGGSPIEVLKGVDMTLERGNSVSIRGESGSGKTTLLNIIAGLEKADSGTVSLNGMDLHQLSEKKLASVRCREIGMVFQAYHLIPELDVEENVLMAARILGDLSKPNRGRARELLKRVGLGGRLNSSPMQLSGGEKQRVALARALMNRPTLILADEPTGNLDEKTAHGVIDLIFEVCREENSSLVMVTHNPKYAARTDRQLLLNHGLLSNALNHPSGT